MGRQSVAYSRHVIDTTLTSRLVFCSSVYLLCINILGCQNLNVYLYATVVCYTQAREGGLPSRRVKQNCSMQKVSMEI